METAIVNQVYTKKEENEILCGLYMKGAITIQEFLEFSDLSFAQKLLNAIRERTNFQPLQSSDKLN